MISDSVRKAVPTAKERVGRLRAKRVYGVRIRPLTRWESVCPYRLWQIVVSLKPHVRKPAAFSLVLASCGTGSKAIAPTSEAIARSSGYFLLSSFTPTVGTSSVAF